MQHVEAMEKLPWQSQGNVVSIRRLIIIKFKYRLRIFGLDKIIAGL